MGRKVSVSAHSKMYENQEFDKEVELLHCVYPRDDVDKGKKAATMLPVASVYIDEKEKHVLAEGGFDEMPYMVSRWSKTVGEVFGRSPAMTALPDIKMLQEIMKTTIKAAQKIVDPPLLVPDDGVSGSGSHHPRWLELLSCIFWCAD
jgi:hypothetical protein